MNLYDSPHSQGEYYQKKKENQREEIRNLIQQILKIFQNMFNHLCTYSTRKNLKNYLIDENGTTKSI